MSSDLSKASRSFELYKVDNGSYPTDMPADIQPSTGVVLSPTIAPAGSFCLNAYNQGNATLKVSYDSQNGLQQNTLCSGAPIGGTAGGSVPQAPRGTNLAPSFAQWTLTGSASYNSPTGEISFGTSGTARSPLIRVDSPASFTYLADMFATTPSTQFTPQGGYASGMNFYGSDGVTAVTNSGGFTSNGCAKAVPLNAWQTPAASCGYAGGPNVIYITYVYYYSATYSSSDLKLKNPQLIIN